MRRKIRYYQYDFEDIYGQEWKTDPVRITNKKDSQLSLADYFDKSVLGEENEDDFIRGKMKQIPKWKIMCQTIEAGDRVEINIYPVPTSRKDIPRSKDRRDSLAAQKNLNAKNSQKRLVRMMCCNFHKGDLILTLTYRDRYYPTQEQARKDIRGYIKKLREQRKKQGLVPLKYIYVTEFVPEGEDTRKIRIHHHMIINGMDRDIAESLWGKGRAESKYAQPDDFELEGFASYISKLSFEKNHHKWVASRNLDKPVEHRSVTLLSRMRFAEIIKSNDKESLLESLYQGRLKYLDSTTYINKHHGGFYLYSRMRRKESIWETQEDVLPQGEPDCRAYLDYDWRGSFAKGEAVYSVLLEAKRKNGEPAYRKVFGRFTKTTKGRAILEMARMALEQLKPCHVEFHSPGRVLMEGITGNQFALRGKDGYRGVKNKDLVKGFMEAAEGFTLSAVSEKENKYSTDMKLQRELEYAGMGLKEDKRDA